MTKSQIRAKHGVGYYKVGWSVRSIAKYCGVTRHTVYRWLHNADVIPRGPAGRPRRPKTKPRQALFNFEEE